MVNPQPDEGSEKDICSSQDHHFGYWTCFGDQLDRYILLSIGVSKRKKKEKRWGEEQRRKKEKKEAVEEAKEESVEEKEEEKRWERNWEEGTR